MLSAVTALLFLGKTLKVQRVAASRRQTPPITFSTAATRNAMQKLAPLAWTFEPNVGQSAPEVKFLSRGRDAAVFLTDDSVYISWDRLALAGDRRSAAKPDFLKIEFAGAGRSTTRAGDIMLPGKTNYLLGRNPRLWRTNVPHYKAVEYRELYPGVDVRFYGGAQGLEYDLTAARDGDLRQIVLRVRGADALRLDRQGDLVMHVGARQLTMKRPHVYQPEGKARKSIAGGYRLLSDNEVGFEVGRHRSDLPLVIDPSISIAYTTFLGGNGAENGNSVAVDSSGNVYVGGTTNMPNFPGDPTTSTEGPANGTSTLFVAKVNPALTGAPSLVYLTFIGGSGNDQGGMVALDNSPASASPPGPPNLAVLGWSTSSNFPTTTGALPAGSPNLTVSDLNGTGNGFIYSEYYGGSGAEATQGTGSIVTNSTGGGIATDSSGDVFVTSDTNSTNLPTPTPPNGFQSNCGGVTTGCTDDGFLAEFQVGTGALLYSTYFGINATTVGGSGVAVDSSGNAYVAGFTSTPTMAISFTNTFQGTYPGGSLDGFVMEINPTISGVAGLTYGGFIGGSQSDQALSIAVDTSTPPDAYVSGLTQSTNLIPSTGVTFAPFQSSLGTGATQNGFFAVINQSTTPPVLQYITYLGGSGSDAAQSVAVVSPTQVYVAGNATSTNFPILCTLQGFSGTQDAFLAELNPSVGGTSSLLSSTFLGGTVTAQANAVGESSGTAIVFGTTLSNDYPLAGNPQNGFQPICASCQLSTPEPDAFLTTLNISASATIGCVAFSQSSVQFGSFADGTTSPPSNLTLTNDGTASLGISSITVTGANSGDFSVANDTCMNASLPPAMPPAPAGTCNFSITFTPTIIGTETAQLQLTDDGVGSPQVLNLNGTGTGLLVSPSGNSLTFPNTPQGQVSAEQIVTLVNTTTDTLTVQASSIQGTYATDFEYGTENNCTSTIVPSSSCTVAVQFAPNEPNPPSSGLALSAQDVLSIVDESNNSTQSVTVALSGTEIPTVPGIGFSPTSLTFASQNVGGTTAPQTITVTSNGSAPLVISSVGVSGSDPGDFQETDNCVTSSPLPTNATCTISATFKPTATGSRTANVSVADNVNPSPQTVSLTGTGTAAGVTLTPSNLTFAGQNPGTSPSPPQTVTLQNTGTGPLTISNITITGTNASDFAETNNCPGSASTLPAGLACSIAVTFAPTGTGARSASLSISDTAIPSPQSVGLSGIGTVPAAQFNVSEVAFGTVVVGAQSTSQPVQLNNTGNGTLVISAVGFAGANPGDFQASGSCVTNGTVAAGSNCTVAVIFAPTAAGSRTAELSVNDNAPGSPQQLSVTGTATNIQLGPISGSSTSVTITAGETATFNLQVTPVNGFSGNVPISCADPIPASICLGPPSPVNVSGTQSVPFAVSVGTTARNGAVPRGPLFTRPMGGHGRIVLAVGLWLLVFAFLAGWKPRSRGQRLLRPAMLLAGFLLLSGCGGGGSGSSSGTPAGTYTVVVAGAIPGVVNPPTISLTVTVQ